MAAHNFLLATPMKSLPPPFSKYHGTKIKVLGSFWPGGPESDKQKLFTILVIDSDDKYKASNDMSRSIFYSLYLQAHFPACSEDAHVHRKALPEGEVCV